MTMTPSQNTATEAGSPAPASGQFDIVARYKAILAELPDITMPLAAIGALIGYVNVTPSTTTMETIEMVQAQVRLLHAAFPNPVPLRAGTDLFEKMLLPSSLRGQAATASAPTSSSADSQNTKTPAHGNHQTAARSHPSQSETPTTPATENEPLQGTSALSFDELRNRLIISSVQFVEKATEARGTIAEKGSKQIRDGFKVVTTGSSRTVSRLLLRAAERVRFKLFYVMDGNPETAAAVTALENSEAAAPGHNQRLEIERVPIEGTAHTLRTEDVDLVLLGTEVVCANGGLLSRKGTYQLALLAHALKKKVVVAAETHKIASDFPDAGLKRFGVTADDVDYTPPDLITTIVTEEGSKLPANILLHLYNQGM